MFCTSAVSFHEALFDFLLGNVKKPAWSLENISTQQECGRKDRDEEVQSMNTQRKRGRSAPEGIPMWEERGALKPAQNNACSPVTKPTTCSIKTSGQKPAALKHNRTQTHTQTLKNPNLLTWLLRW